MTISTKKTLMLAAIMLAGCDSVTADTEARARGAFYNACMRAVTHPEHALPELADKRADAPMYCAEVADKAMGEDTPVEDDDHERQ